MVNPLSAVTPSYKNLRYSCTIRDHQLKSLTKWQSNRCPLQRLNQNLDFAPCLLMWRFKWGKIYCSHCALREGTETIMATSELLGVGHTVWSIGITDHLTNSLKYSCSDVCGTIPWLSYVGSDNETSSDSWDIPRWTEWWIVTCTSGCIKLLYLVFIFESYFRIILCARSSTRLPLPLFRFQHDQPTHYFEWSAESLHHLK